MAEFKFPEEKNLVFIGEAGSGKTETAVNLALRMAREGERRVHFFDMDQTKPLFRARDCEAQLEREGVVFHFQAQYLDAPTVASGVIETLRDEGSAVIMDIGGGSHGSHMIGQFSHLLNSANTLVLYIVNPFRPWSGSREDIEVTMRRVLGAARLGSFSLVADPHLGPAEADLSAKHQQRQPHDQRGGAVCLRAGGACQQIGRAGEGAAASDPAQYHP